MRLNNDYFILRHGEAVSNRKKIVSSWPEKIHNHLTKEGREQVKASALKLKNEKIDIIFSSDLLRTKQSAEIVAKTIKVRIIFDKRLREIKMGIFNSKQEQSWNDFFRSQFKRFVKRPLNGENYRDVKKRTIEFIKEINKKHKNKKILIVSHGCVLFSLQAAIKNLTEKEEMRHRQKLILKTGELRRISNQ